MKRRAVLETIAYAVALLLSLCALAAAITSGSAAGSASNSVQSTRASGFSGRSPFVRLYTAEGCGWPNTSRQNAYGESWLARIAAVRRAASRMDERARSATALVQPPAQIAVHSGSEAL